MSKTKITIAAAASVIIGAILIVFGVLIYSKSVIVHPDRVITIFNTQRHTRTQAYLIGDLQMYIDSTSRVTMESWKTFVEAQGQANHPGFTMEGRSLGLGKDDPTVNPNPFVLKMSIKNLNTIPRHVFASQIKIRTESGKIYHPNLEWQEAMADAGMFSGVDKNDMAVLQPNETKVMYLVYGTTTDKNAPPSEDFIQFDYDSLNEWLATKVEFPFNFVDGTPYGDYEKIMDDINRKGAIAIFLLFGIVGMVYYRAMKNAD